MSGASAWSFGLEVHGDARGLQDVSVVLSDQVAVEIVDVDILAAGKAIAVGAELHDIVEDRAPRDQAFAWLDKAYDDHSEFMLWLKWDPRFDALRSDPRFEELVRKVADHTQKTDTAGGMQQRP